MCAFKIRIQLLEVIETEDGETSQVVEQEPARYIPRDQDYVDVRVPYSETA